MSTNPKDELFHSYLRRPISSAWVELLSAQEDRIYALCRQILRHSQDAEDACQEVFLEILRHVRTFRDATHFKHWVTRVALHAALQLKRKSDRRRKREREATLMEPSRDPADLHDRVHAALADLDDEARTLVVQHFFEKRTLEHLAEEYGCSTVAIWKKIAKGKEDLKESLVRAEGTTAALGLDLMLESLIPHRAPAGLVEAFTLGHAAEVSANGLAGTIGAIGMGTKPLFALVAAAFVLLVGFSSVHLHRSRAESRRLEEELQKSQAELQLVRAEAARQRKQGSLPLTSAAEKSSTAEDPRGSTSTAAATAGKPDPSPPAKENQLVQRLIQLRERARKRESLYTDKDWLSYLAKEARDLQAMILEDPATYVAFLKSPENDDPFIFGGILQALSPPYKFDRDVAVTRPIRADELPEVVRKGLLEILETGSTTQRAAILQFFKVVTDLGEEVQPVLLALMSDREPSVQLKALEVLTAGQEFFTRRPIPESSFPTLREMADKSGDLGLKKESLRAIGQIGTPEAEAYFFAHVGTLASAKPADGNGSPSFDLLKEKLSRASPEDLDRYATLMNGAVQQTSEPFAFGSLAQGALSLPAPYALRVLESAIAAAPSPALRAALEQVVEDLRRGETNRKGLEDVVRKATVAKP